MIPLQIIITHKEIPTDYLRQIGDLNPDCQLMFYNDFDAAQFISKHFSPEVLRAYHSVLPGAYKADLFRYCALYYYGGIYTDVDIPYEHAFTDMWDLQQSKIYLTRDLHPATIQIATMATPPKASFFELCIKSAVHNILTENYGPTPMSITGPHMAWRCFTEYTGQKNTDFGEYPAMASASLPIQIDYKLVHTPDHIRETLVEAVYVNKDGKYVCAYKPNKERLHRSNKDYYTNAWLEKRVFA